MNDLINEVGHDEAWRRYRQLGRHAFLPRATLRRIIEQERPSLVVVTNSPKSERAAIIEGNAAGIETLIVPDFFASSVWEAYHPFEAKWYAAMCSVTADNLVREHKADSSRVVITGQPAFDKKHVLPVGECHAYALDLLKGAHHLPYVLVATSSDSRPGVIEPPQNIQSINVVRQLLKIAHRFPEIHFVIKPHPSESSEQYSVLTANHPSVSVVPQKSDINRLLRASVGMLAATMTTAIIDALSLDVRVMVANLEKRVSAIPYQDFHIPVIVSPDQMEACLRSFLSGSARDDKQAEVRKWFQATNGKATQNLALLIEDLACKRYSSIQGYQKAL